MYGAKLEVLSEMYKERRAGIDKLSAMSFVHLAIRPMIQQSKDEIPVLKTLPVEEMFRVTNIKRLKKNLNDMDALTKFIAQTF
jgi:hypothetical protein